VKKDDRGRETKKTIDARASVNKCWFGETGTLCFELKSSSEFATAKPTDVTRAILGEVAMDRLVITKTAATFAEPKKKPDARAALPVTH
jgi:hypothetical protein